MALEVELKAHINDPASLLGQLREHNHLCEHPIDRFDTYLYSEKADRTIRLRREGASLLVTTKERNTEARIEVNQEYEFSTDATAEEELIQFFSSLEYAVVLTKQKAGFGFTSSATDLLPALLIEVCEVAPLGWFVELEYVVADERVLVHAKRGLLEALDRLKIARSAIESRPYATLLCQ
ncbi:MAG TPA: CYTH domain-containing protein [Sphaerochaeta sp.]|nr:CYTH domain-containing protein [Sphaerochaeta sp.]